MTLGRRDFLQRLSAVLAALGVTDSWLAGSVGAYQSAFAETNQRFALLVGINAYPEKVWRSPAKVETERFLQGAVTDVELQRELLIHRLGVDPQNIVTLANAEATVNQILTTAQSHLVEQAKPGDTVILHFSGLGSQATLSDQATDPTFPTLVAADSYWPDETMPVIHDLFTESLMQLLAKLRGVRVLTVIDASSTLPPTLRRGNFRVRSRLASAQGAWQSPASIPLTKPTKTWQQLATDWPGILLHPQLGNGVALEGNWPDFSAGLFTYALTQQIWMSMPAQRQQWFMRRIDRKLSAWTGTDQTSEIFGKAIAQRPGIPLLSGRLPQPAADGVIKTIDQADHSAIVWLGGLPSGLLPYCELGLQLQPLPTLPGLTAVPEGVLQVKTLNGLRAKTTLKNLTDLPIGTPIIEVERRFPKEIDLTVALDPALERIERVDATSALSGLPSIATTAPGEGVADCLFGKSRSLLSATAPSPVAKSIPLEAADLASEQSTVPPGYGLFTPDGSLIAGTTAEEEEAVKTAITRLTATLHSLLAVKILRLTLNPVSSQLPVRLVLETQAPDSKLLLLEETLRSRQLNGSSLSQSERLTFGSLTRNRPEQYQIRLRNAGTETVYYLLFSVVDKSRLSVYCPPFNMAEGSEQTSQVIARESSLPGDTAIKYPKMPETSFALQPLKTTEVFAVACTQPLLKTWKAIRTTGFRYQSDRWAVISDPLSVTQALLHDLHDASGKLKPKPDAPAEHTLTLKSNAWATLSL
ncbi:caspase family protein [Leptolyngbya iicbica]|uniref:Caspase family protein n=2 Tax=Cyanophyceae TaxID=3028117 RepID=A0A4Q7E0B5_9CYAN|nr:caspase family protein [Leptolyngbya sp. LK]RZM74429.1 caspase family protein [Leptolyngbya sp. LK]